MVNGPSMSARMVNASRTNPVQVKHADKSLTTATATSASKVDLPARARKVKALRVITRVGSPSVNSTKPAKETLSATG